MPGTATISWINYTSSNLYVQKKAYNSTGNLTTHTITVDSTPSSGNLMVMVINNNDAISSFSGWTLAENRTDFVDVSIYYKTAGGSESTSISVTLGNSKSLVMAYYEFSGMTNALDVDSSNFGQGGAGTINTGTTATTSTANSIIIAIAGYRTGVTTTSWDNGFTEDQELASSGSATNMGMSIAIKSVSATGTYTANATLSGNQGNNIGIIAVFPKS